DDPESLPKDGEGNPKDWPVHLDRHGFRLPTEAEWEYVCRSGASTSFSFGNDHGLLKHYGWFVANSEKWSHGVGQRRPNPHGLFDVHGNLFEWCHDWYGEYEPDESEDVGGASGGRDRVSRGGCWSLDAAYCRSANRNTLGPSSHTYNLGFRLALSPSGGRPEAVQAK
ncbi:MAG: formylglycine-generating enzyme family protein, partial [Planctomycetes bacterium]|nr:formylglycine-generating enzyme family protein [Planctomycetota bacterium]